MTRDRGSIIPSVALVVVCLLAGWVLLGCGAPSSSAPVATDPAVPPTIEVVAQLPALAVEYADRSTLVPATVEQAAPFDPVAYVDSLAIDRWTPFVYDVISKESGGCPNAVGGDLFVVGTCSEYQRKGNREDSGQGQVTTSLYGRNGTLCTREGICSQWQIISSPWVSMLALVATLEHHGRLPWCYDARSRAYHACNLVTSTERPL